jgi:hypothetical protein
MRDHLQLATYVVLGELDGGKWDWDGMCWVEENR